MTRVASIQGPPLDGYIVTSDDAHQVITIHIVINEKLGFNICLNITFVNYQKIIFIIILKTR